MARIDDDFVRAWAAEWIANLLVHEGVDPTPEVKGSVWSALASLASAPPEQRTLTDVLARVRQECSQSAVAEVPSQETSAPPVTAGV